MQCTRRRVLRGLVHINDLLDEALGKANDGGWPTVDRVVRGTGPARNLAQDSGRVLTITRNVPALVALDPDGAVLERIEP